MIAPGGMIPSDPGPLRGGVAGLTAGRMVHYVPQPYEPASQKVHVNHGTHRPGIVVCVWDETGTVNLQVFFDGENDGYALDKSVVWKTSVRHDPAGAAGTWHFIEHV